MGLKVPRHRIDHDPIFVYREDSAWDHSRIKREKEEHFNGKTVGDGSDAKKNPEPYDHPVERYLRGKTRFDLSARDKVGSEVVCAADYLDGTEVRWRLRRLPVTFVRGVGDKIGTSGSAASLIGQTFAVAAQLGLVGVSGMKDHGLEWAGGELTDDSLIALRDIDPNLDFAIGEAAWMLSKPLDEAEKKL